MNLQILILAIYKDVHMESSISGHNLHMICACNYCFEISINNGPSHPLSEFLCASRLCFATFLIQISQTATPSSFLDSIPYSLIFLLVRDAQNIAEFPTNRVPNKISHVNQPAGVELHLPHAHNNYK